MKPRITTLSKKKLIGCKQSMNYAAYNQSEKWAAIEISDFDLKIVQAVLNNLI